MASPENPDKGQQSKDMLAAQARALQECVHKLNEELQDAHRTVEHLRKQLKLRTSKAEGQGEENDEQSLTKQLERQSMILERDNAVARKLQQSMRPLWLSDFEGVEFASECRSGERVGGDFYDVIQISDATMGLMIGDVSGHGLPAAVIMATARMAFRTFATTESSPKLIMEKGNKALLDSTLAGHHLTAFLGLIDTEMLTFRYVNASHCPPYLIRDGIVESLDSEGLFVGMFEDPQYEEKNIQLKKNDKLFFYTDGALDMFESRAREEAIHKLQNLLEKNADFPVQKLVSNICEQISEEPQDDVLIFALQLLNRRAKEKQITIPSIPSEVSRVEDVILPALSAKGYGERYLFAVKLALEEAIINAIKHGNKLDSTKKVRTNFILDENKTIISVADEGEGFDPGSIPDPIDGKQLDSVYGRGVALMKAYMDSVEYNEKGNKVTMTKYAPWHSKNSGS